jgi:hypothetical protein
MSQYNIAYFEKDNCGRLVDFNEQYLADIGIADKNSIKGKCESDIDVLKDFYSRYLRAEREVRLLKKTSIQKEYFYFDGEGKKPVITTRKYMSTNDVEIKGYYFKLQEKPVTWDGRYITIHNFFKPVKLTLLKFYILTLRCHGLSNYEISKKFHRAESTIRNTTHVIFDTFGIYEFIELARYYDLGGWLNKLTISLLEQKFQPQVQPSYAVNNMKKVNSHSIH